MRYLLRLAFYEDDSDEDLYLKCSPFSIWRTAWSSFPSTLIPSITALKESNRGERQQAEKLQ